MPGTHLGTQWWWKQALSLFTWYSGSGEALIKQIFTKEKHASTGVHRQES